MQAIDPALGWANRMLEREDWARARLAAHSGRSVRLICGPVDSSLTITPAGMLARSSKSTSASATADVTLTISPLRLPALLAHPERWSELVAAEGDTALASTLGDLARTLPWLVEETFARAFGPVIGTRVAAAGEALLTLPEHVAASFATSMTGYVRNEAGFGVRTIEVARLADDIAAVAERLAALEQRLRPLAGDGDASAPAGGNVR
jgi:ubiquinone biosynthesis protein UbiJ